MKNEARVGRFLVGGQPSAAELAPGRFRAVVNIRGAAEEGNETETLVAGSATRYTPVPWTIDTVRPEDIERIRAAVEGADGDVLIH